MNRTKAIGKLVSMIVAGAHALSAAGASAATGPAQNVPDQPGMTVDSVLSTIDRINRGNPTAATRIEIALVAGQSELIAAIVQEVRTCTGDLQACVHRAIVRAGGLSTRNLISLAELSSALEALGVSSSTIADALDAYSTEVAAAVSSGAIPEQFAAITLAGGSGSLYL
jgi:hypothetical protein